MSISGIYIRVAWRGQMPRNEAAEDLQVDYTSPFGRLTARLWLAEQGHPTDCDIPEVLAWSVASVAMGGEAIVGVAPVWKKHRAPGRELWCRRGHATATDREWNLWARRGRKIVFGPETGEAGKAAADAALLRLGYALETDGGYVLPSLPGDSK